MSNDSDFDAAKRKAEDMLEKLDPQPPRSQRDYMLCCMMALWNDGMKRGREIEHQPSAW